MNPKVGDIICITSVPHIKGEVVSITDFLVMVKWDHLADVLLYNFEEFTESRYRLLSKLELALYEIKSKED